MALDLGRDCSAANRGPKTQVEPYGALLEANRLRS